LGTRELVVAAIVAVGWGTALGAQAPAPKASPARAAEAPYVPARTPDGQPNISGMWLPDPNGRPMEVPAGTPWKPPAGFDPGTNAAYTFFAPENGTVRRERDRRPMIIDPPDGRIPLQPWAAEQREKIVAGQEKAELLDPRVRCLQSGLPRANLPVFYNSYHIIYLTCLRWKKWLFMDLGRIVPIPSNSNRWGFGRHHNDTTSYARDQ